jgi:hypothetical protein
MRSGQVRTELPLRGHRRGLTKISNFRYSDTLAPSPREALQLRTLLFQWFFEEMNVINPDRSFAIDNNVQGNLLRTLSWL